MPAQPPEFSLAARLETLGALSQPVSPADATPGLQALAMDFLGRAGAPIVEWLAEPDIDELQRSIAETRLANIAQARSAVRLGDPATINHLAGAEINYLLSSEPGSSDNTESQ